MKKTEYETYAVTLYFDENINQKILELIKEIYLETGNDYMIKNSVPPHLSLGLFHVKKEEIEILEKVFKEFAGFLKNEKEELFLNFYGADNFSDKVIFLGVIRDELLMSLNKKLHQLFLPFFEAGDNRNYLPENWMPHVALAVKMNEQQFEKGFSYAKKVFFPKTAKICSITLAECNPYKEVEKIEL
ncbi:MAG: hypothetical protein IKX23_06375 [Treponema sp.]|nr:hypothetical protein [Treponema sp.]